MAKLIAMIVLILMFLAGILLVALGIGIGLLLLVVGLMGIVAMGIVLGSRGSITDIFTPRGFFDSFIKTKVDKPDKDVPANIWDQMAKKNDKNK